jgi:hypothetical protein
MKFVERFATIGAALEGLNVMSAGAVRAIRAVEPLMVKGHLRDFVAGFVMVSIAVVFAAWRAHGRSKG